MKYEVVPNSCRVCLRKYKKLRSIFRPLEEGDEPPNEMLKKITGISVEKGSDAGHLPKNICKGCELSLNLAFQFRCLALKSQRIIETFCSNQNSKDIAIADSEDSFKSLKDEIEFTVEVKEENITLDLIEVVDEEVETDEQLNSSNQMKIEDLELPFSDDAKVEFLEGDEKEYNEYYLATSSSDEEPLSALHKQQQQQQQTHHKIKILKDANYSDSDLSTKSIETTHEIEKEFVTLNKLQENKQHTFKAKPVNFETSEKHIRTAESCKRLKKSKLNDDAEICTKIDANKMGMDIECKPKVMPKKSGRPRNTDESGYICDICGNIFAKRGRMTEHRRLHDTELHFGCELCDKRFSHREKLRKHMFSHSGGKPFQCSYCSRTFFYESVKKAHEAVHKGVKPYICEICHKAFAYSHALKKHKLIHADIKLYHCEYCDKDFRLQHHMKQHEETKLHQNAVKHSEAVKASMLTVKN